jgi:hypothetical protein
MPRNISSGVIRKPPLTTNIPDTTPTADPNASNTKILTGISAIVR